MKIHTRKNARNDFLDTLATKEAGELIGDSFFEGANCQHAKFNDAWVTLATFNDAMLIHADFSGVLLHGVQFQRADLTGAIFENAILKNCDFSGADLTGVYFTPEQKNSIKKVRYS